MNKIYIVWLLRLESIKDLKFRSDLWPLIILHLTPKLSNKGGWEDFSLPGIWGSRKENRAINKQPEFKISTGLLNFRNGFILRNLRKSALFYGQIDCQWKKAEILKFLSLLRLSQSYYFINVLTFKAFHLIKVCSISKWRSIEIHSSNAKPKVPILNGF